MKKAILILLLVLLRPYNLLAEPVEHDIHIEWSYEQVEGQSLVGYNLYKEAVKICSTNVAAARSMDCVFTSEYGVFDFTLTAFFDSGHESPKSTPYTFELTENGPILIAPVIMSVHFN